MSIRNAAKAIILHGNKVLLNKCHSPDVGEYFVLPGVGQNQYETMEEAVIRECLEETRYTVVPLVFAALYEEIYTLDSFRQGCPDYAHKVHHIFKCSIANGTPIAPAEQDSCQLDCVWVELEDITFNNLLPSVVSENQNRIIHSKTPIYLGSHLIDKEKTI